MPDMADQKLRGLHAVGRTVAQLAGILRVADAMDRRHGNRVLDLNSRRTRNVFHIEATSTFECEHELTEAGRRLKLFEKAFSAS